MNLKWFYIKLWILNMNHAQVSVLVLVYNVHVSPTPKHIKSLDESDLPGWGKADIGNGSIFVSMSPTFYDELPIHQ